MAIRKVIPNLTLEKRTTRPGTASLQFEELCACLNGQYLSMRVINPDRSEVILEGDAFMRALKSAHPVVGRDGAGRTMRGNMSNYYVVDVMAA